MPALTESSTALPPLARRSDGRVLAWSRLLEHPGPETAPQKWRARIGGLVAIVFATGEAVGVPALLIRLVTPGDIGRASPQAVDAGVDRWRVAAFIPTYDEPAEVIAPTIAASVDLAPADEAWLLDDGDRPWVRDPREEYGARYVSRPTHEHAKAGNINHALKLADRDRASRREPTSWLLWRQVAGPSVAGVA